ncbi:DUF3667 domain-containing protein [Brevundimonas sp. FT23028]|uniref:DUF3667 domain-containing protein n=1 Tax=Brevundimonas sp. FT23028 TaxID=3393748 RepID=UPI003B58752C
MDIDAAGGVVTGGLIAGAIEKPTGKAGDDHTGICADCGAETSGNFCSNCGQPTHVHRTLLHLFEEVLHGVMHFDARIWRTLPLLWLNPGRLTREWVQGRRARYVSPLAMFLFTMFVMFFALSFMPSHPAEAPGPERIASQRQDLVEAEQALAEVKAGFADQTSPVAVAAIGAADETVRRERTRLTEVEREVREGRPDGLVPGSWQANLKDAAESGKKNAGSGHGFAATLLKKLQNPDLAIYKLQQTIYKFAFLLVPLSIPFVALLFLWKRGFTLYDHGVFVLYSLTFMAMLLMLMVLAASLNSVLGGLVITLGILGIPVHMFAQLKSAYGLSVFSALWRTVFLVTFCNVVVGLFLTAIVYLGLGH